MRFLTSRMTLNRHSHRVVDTLEALAAVVHPGRFADPGEKVRRVSTVPIESESRGKGEVEGGAE